MEIQFYGAARTVTGSMHLLRAHGKNILLDCGLFQGKRAEAYERNRNFPFDASSIDAVVLSHAHTDHAGNLPNLVKAGFSGPIHSTHATKDLCRVMLLDSAHIQERDAEFMNKKHRGRGEPVIEPLYTVDDVTRTMNQFVGIGYHQPFGVADGVECSFADAGHILGSAVTRIVIDRNGTAHAIGFTGDLGRKNAPIIRDPEPIGKVDVLISESTYGGRIHDVILGTKAALRSVIRKTADRGGKVLIPSFSVGRTQELVFMMTELFDSGALPPVPIYIDSPLAANATDVFRLHPECFDSETLLLLNRHEDPFGFGRLTYVRSVEDSKKLNTRQEPMVIIAASGMCEGGRILHHLANNIENPANTVLIVGFPAEHTLGRRLVEQQPEVKIFGDCYRRNAEVVVINSLSAHAGQDELLEYACQVLREKTSAVYLVHGELSQAGQMTGKLGEQGFTNVIIPGLGDRVELFP